MTPSWPRLLVCAVVLGVVAAGLVWWLERFEVEKLHNEVGKYLTDHDAFRQWQAEHGQGETA